MLALCRVAFPRLGQPLRTAMPGPRSEMTFNQDTHPSPNIRSAFRVSRPPVHWTDRHSANRDRAGDWTLRVSLQVRHIFLCFAVPTVPLVYFFLKYQSCVVTGQCHTRIEITRVIVNSARVYE